MHGKIIEFEGSLTVTQATLCGQARFAGRNARNVQGFVVGGPAVVRSGRGFAPRSLCELARWTRLERPPRFARRRCFA
jgi:hypothetical protein